MNFFHKSLWAPMLALCLWATSAAPAPAAPAADTENNSTVIVEGSEKALLPADSIVIQNDRQASREAAPLPANASGSYVLKADGTIDLESTMRLRRDNPDATQDVQIVVLPASEPRASKKGEFPPIKVTVYKRVKVYTSGSGDHHKKQLASRSARSRVVAFYTKVQEQVDIAPLILKYASKYHLDPYLVKAVIHTESRFRPQATSGAGAAGLMQLMPSTAYRMGASDPYDMEQNIAAGSKYLRLMLDMFHDKTETALAAYNAGPGTVQACGGIPGIYETQCYVKKVMNAYKSFKKAAATE